MAYEFTNDWFGATGRYIWQAMLPKFGPTRILEIGSYEGRATCFLIEALKRPLDIHCIDTWKGGSEHSEIDMDAVKERFHKNTALAIDKSKQAITLKVYEGRSDDVLAQMQTEYKDYFDFVYVDGSHVAADVMSDAVLAFRLLCSGGIMCFDDYLWKGGDPIDPINCPKMAIDAFTMLYCRQLNVLALPPTQLFVEKL